MNSPSLPPQNAQAMGQENIPTHSIFSDDHWEPSLEDDAPQEADEQFIPFNVTPMRSVPSAQSNNVGDGSLTPITQQTPDTYDAASLHLSPDSVDSVSDTQLQAPKSSRQHMLLEQMGFYSWFILVPFLFAVLTGLIILPLVASSRAYLPTQALIPLIIVLLVIAIAQSISIYYVGTDNGLWAVCTLTGFCLFTLIGCYTLFGALPTLILFVIFVVLYMLLYRRCVHIVAPSSIEIVQSFGQYRRTLTSGLNILFPWEHATPPLSLEEIPWSTPVQRVQLTQTEDIVLRGRILYQLQPRLAHHAILDVRDWEGSLHDIFVAKLQDIAASLTPDSITRLRAQRNYMPYNEDTTHFTAGDSRWQHINEKLLQETQSRVSRWGVHVIEVQVFDVALAAHRGYDAALDDDTTPASYMQQGTQTTAAASAAAPPKSETSKLEQPKSAPAQAAQPVQAASVAQQAQLLAPNVFKEEALISAYRAVQSGSVKDPETIRNLAKQFETVAKDPNLYQNVSFDAMRAAVNLLKEADRREEEMAARAGTLFNDETNPDFHKPDDESSFLGA